jgi:hypothetical protein
VVIGLEGRVFSCNGSILLRNADTSSTSTKCLSCVITLGNLAVNLKLSGVFLAQFLTTFYWAFCKRKSLSPHSQIPGSNISANPHSQVMKGKKVLAKQNNSTQSNLCNIAIESHYIMIPIGGI